MKVIMFRWREKRDGEDFHARYLLTERGGIAADAGFSAEESQQTTDMHLMTYDSSLIFSTHTERCRACSSFVTDPHPKAIGRDSSQAHSAREPS
jgi:hypothetical protein